MKLFSDGVLFNSPLLSLQGTACNNDDGKEANDFCSRACFDPAKGHHDGFCEDNFCQCLGEYRLFPKKKV